MMDAKTIWENIVKMGAHSSIFIEGSPEWKEAARCRISGYLNALSDVGAITKEDQKLIFGEVWIWFEHNKDQLK
ncbi:MAG: hypothetical protein WC998_08810 [Candidatus Paceibacterota bacterium]|jgi:hypothetical protein